MYLGNFKSFYFIVLVLWIQVNTVIGQGKDQLEELSKVSFQIKSFGINVDGTFQNYVIGVEMDTLSLEDSYIHARIPGLNFFHVNDKVKVLTDPSQIFVFKK